MSDAARPLRLAAVHLTPTLGAVEQNRAAAVALARRAGASADLVVLPELVTTGFTLSAERAAALAEPIEGPTAAALAAVARETGAVVVAGLAVRSGSALRNAQVVLGPRGRLLGWYAKHHLYGDDHAWATAGPTPGATVETPLGPIGLLICHDVAYPATVRAVASRAPRVVALSTAWIGDGSPLPAEWSAAAAALAPAPLVVANRGGREGAWAFADSSAILSGRGVRCSPSGAGPFVVHEPPARRDDG